MENFALFDQNRKLTRLSSFFNFFFYGLERRFFLLEYRETDLDGLFCLKEKDGKFCTF